MPSHARFSNRAIAFVCSLLLALPIAAQAASDEELAILRAQIQALSERLDQLEAENRALSSVNSRVAAEPVPAQLPAQAEDTDWTDSLHWQGDFRYRFESFAIEGQPDSNRNRIRARAVLIADVTPTIEVGLGLASGGDDPVSSNQTLGGGGSTKDLRLDLAYFDWSGLANTHIVGGKFKNYLHRSGRNALLWDSDWRPEGTGIVWNNGRFFVSGLGTWIESDSSKEQSFAFLTQAGVHIPLGDSLNLTAGLGYHRFDTKGNGSFFGDDNDFFGNSFNPVTTTYLYNYHEIELFADLDFSLFDLPALIFANYSENQAADEYAVAYALGFTIGQAKNQGEWEFGYVYQELEADSILGLLTDSDFGGGGTDAKGHIFKGGYTIVKNINANFTYFINQVGLKSGDPIDFKRLQLNLNFKY